MKAHLSATDGSGPSDPAYAHERISFVPSVKFVLFHSEQPSKYCGTYNSTKQAVHIRLAQKRDHKLNSVYHQLFPPQIAH